MVGVTSLLARPRKVRPHEQAAALADLAAHAPLDDPAGIGHLLIGLRDAWADELAAALLALDPAAHAPLDDPGSVAFLLGSLNMAGAHEQAAALAHRAAAHIALNRRGMAELLDRMRAAGAGKQVVALSHRLSAVGQFDLFLKHKDLADQFRFGREADGTPAAPWGWETWTYGLFPTAGTVR